MANDKAYQKLHEHYKEVAMLESCSGVLAWDERTYLPKGGGVHRGDQLALLAGMLHDRLTDSRLDDLLDSAAQSFSDPLSVEAVNVREWRRSYDRATKLPKKLVEELTRVTTIGQQVWGEAREQNDYEAFKPTLAEILVLKKEEAAALSEGRGLYDTLLDEFEPGETSANLKQMFKALRDDLIPLVEAIGSAAKKPDLSILHRDYPEDLQASFGEMAAAAIGFDFGSGRLDVSTHPFCCGMGPRDTRITTRYDRNELNQSFFGILHEAGHGLYDQGLDSEHWGMPMGEAVSLGIHESQSRMWENFVGRSAGFWRHFYPKLKDVFPAQLSNVSEDDFVFAVNDVRPSTIRVEADEVTYNLHILLRFEMEIALMDEGLSVDDVPGLWNEKFEHFFGVTVKDDTDGCLQDIHWSFGGMGYFPTYTLGNLYAAQFFDKAKEDLGDLEDQFAKGEFEPLRSWLTEKVYRQGMRYLANDLVREVTGEPLSHRPLINHLTTKYGQLYGL
jgi:carboxypeptidase Taq